MKQILLFGATGGTGKEVVIQALRNGFAVTIIVRDPAKWDLPHSALTILKGDVMQPATFEKEMIGKAAVISCLGTGKDLKPTTLFSAGMKNIISAMNKANVSRLICLSAGALYTTREMGFFIRLLAKVVIQNILKNLFADMRVMEKIVESSNLDWSIIRPPMLKDKPRTNNYRVAVSSHLARPFSIGRADLAHYIVHIINDTATFKSKIEIAY
jgi:putative NADH-flavin reductase